MKIDNPLTGEQEEISSVLMMLAAQEHCDGEPYDQMQAAAEYIRELERKLEQKDAILYGLARLARNTDGMFPSTWGRHVAQLLVKLRGLDETRYNNEVMEEKK